MDISKDKFAAEVGNIIQDIAECHFVAFDLEFSGVAGRSLRKTPGKPSLQELYDEAREAAEKYQVLQVGLTVVKEDAKNGQYIVKPYNFNITQIPTLQERYFKRTWSMNSGAIAFLLKNGFDFGKQIGQGIHYLSRDEESQALKALREYDTTKRPDMLLKPEDDALIQHIRSSVKSWLENSDDNKEEFLNIPADERPNTVTASLNRYQIRLTHQIVQNEFPLLKTRGMNHFVQITNPSPDEAAEKRRINDQFTLREVSRAVGFRWILEAMSGNSIEHLPEDYLVMNLPPSNSTMKSGQSSLKSFVANLNEKLKKRRKVLVGHNCFTDLVNLHQFIIGRLPGNVNDFADGIHELFPAIVDTKYLASLGSARWGDTSLAKVEEDLNNETKPGMIVAPDFDRYAFENFEHEAGYDSLLTAKIAIKLSVKLEREALYKQQATPQTVHDSAETRRFGEGEEYLTPAERSSDISELESIIKSNIRAIEPHTIVKAENPSMTSGEQSVSKQPTEVLVVRQRVRPSTLATESARAASARSAFSSATIYDALDGNTKASLEPEETDLITISEDDRETRSEHWKHENSSAQNTPMIKHELMPRWDSEFWTVFGNRLQVNGCKEGVCQL